MHDLIQLNQQLLERSSKTQFAGYDPFDHLNSRLFQKSGLHKFELCRLAWIQVGKRSPFNMRPYVGVPPERNPKGIGLFILGLIQDYHRTNDESYITTAVSLADWLLTQKSDPARWKHPAWGYHFDWQARAFFVPKGKPNIITTCYVARALLELGDLIERTDFQTAALQSAHFIVESLYTEHDSRSFFAYIPGETAFVHNASLWGAAWVTLVANRTGDSELFEVAKKVAVQSLQEQSLNGSWVYGARHHHQFIDGFHTGYNLEALSMVRDNALYEIAGLNQSIAVGLDYYREHHFTPDGIAKYYDNEVFPLDMHSFSQAIFTFLKVGNNSSDIELVKKVTEKSIDLLYIPKESRFIYQKYSKYTNAVDYIRWTQAWAYYGLAYFNRFFVN